MERIEPLEGIGLVTGDCGAIGTLKIIPISDLRIDTAYQRRMSPGSIQNIRRICTAFDWTKFLPVIVVATRDGDDDVYSVVDGQHRTTAALTLGMTQVPCYVLDCSHAKAAAAFAAINGNITRVSQQDIWFAELAAGVPEAHQLKKVLDASGVKVVRKREAFRAGETSSIAVLKRARERYGEAVLVTILQCITETSDGNPGLIIGAVINGIGRSIQSKLDLLNEPSRLFEIFDGIDLADLLDRAKTESQKTGNPAQFVMTRQINRKIAVAQERRREPA